MGQNSSKRQSSDARQLGCVFQDMTPPKSILRKCTDMPKPIQLVKFTKAIARHTKIRDQNPSLGKICPGEPQQCSPNAPKFEIRSLAAHKACVKSVTMRVHARATPAEIVEVIEIEAPLPAELASPMFVMAPVLEAPRCVRMERAQKIPSAPCTDGTKLAWKGLVVVVSQSSRGVQGFLKLENPAPSVIVTGFHSSATVDVVHDALWEIPTVQGGQTTENLDTASVRHAAKTEIVVVVEIGALLPTESAHPDVRRSTRLGVFSSCCGVSQVRSRCGVFRPHPRSRCRVRDSCAHRFLGFSDYHKNSGVQQSSQLRQCRSPRGQPWSVDAFDKSSTSLSWRRSRSSRRFRRRL